MSYGYFSEDGREFIITRPDTPRPWTNCLTNGTYCSVISQTGGGYSFIGGPGFDRITRADPDMGTFDRPGRYIYIRDNVSGEYFNIGWQPVKKTPEWFECRHSPGVTTIASSNNGIEGKITYFVPLDDNIEIWKVCIKNNRKEQADLSIFTYVEWVLGNFSDDLQERQLSNLFNEAHFHDNYIVGTKRAWRKPDSASMTIRETKPAGGARFIPESMGSNQSWGKFAFIALSVPVHGFDCDREAFIGKYGDISKPQAVERGECSNSEAYGRDAVGVLQTRTVIQPGQEISFEVLLGIALHEADPSGIFERYADPGFVDEKLDAVKSYWERHLSITTVTTPDAELNRSLNIWDKYQSWVSLKTRGMATYARGGASLIGFKESCQDLLAVLPIDQDYAVHRLVEMLQHQYRDGSVMHYWEARSDVGTPTGHLDDMLWLVYAIVCYLKESGNLGFLNDRVKYYYSQSPATVFEHMSKALDFCLTQLSPRGLSLLGPGDWDDTLDAAGREGTGESVLTSQMLCWMLKEAVEIAKAVGDKSKTKVWANKANEISKRINEFAWDGEWYIRAFDDDGNPIGSKDYTEGTIFLNTQSLAVISGTAPYDRETRAMQSVFERLETDSGLSLLQPVYMKPDREIGTLTRIAPGMRQNGGVSTISACWAIKAECILGHGDRAFEILKKSVYPTTSNDQDRFASEPYLHVDYISGPDSDRPGEGSFAWTPAVSAWAWRTCIDWICGVRPEYNGLKIDPCIPSDWKEYSLVRPFQGATYEITVHNPEGLQKGTAEITVDGKKIPDNSLIKPLGDGKVHIIDVTLSKTSA